MLRLCDLFDFLIFQTIIVRQNISKKKKKKRQRIYRIQNCYSCYRLRNPIPLRAMCAVVFSNDAFKPVKLERRLRTVRRNLSDRPPECFSTYFF